MKKLTVVVIIILSFFISGYSQVLDGTYEKENVPSRRPIPYQNIREADVMWAKKIWRIIDLREKINHPLYYPTAPDGGFDSRMSLIDLLLWGIKNEGLTAYGTDDPYNEFKLPITEEQINEKFGAVDRVAMIEDLETGELVETVIKGERKTYEVKEYLVKEGWFFDKQRSIMDVRILGLCPIRHYYKEDDTDQDNVQKKQLFWVYFPETRRIFANHEVFNPHNDAERKTFDDIFFKRLFSSHITREANRFNNRDISQYTIGIKSIIEGEEIKKKIFQIEHDLWEY